MTPEKAQEIRRRYFRREAKQTKLAREYGLAQSSVSRIVSGQVWERSSPRVTVSRTERSQRFGGGQ